MGLTPRGKTWILLAVLTAGAGASGCDGARSRARQRGNVGAPHATSPRDAAGGRGMAPGGATPCQGVDSRPDGVATPGQTRFAVIGDYGQQGPDEERVARLVHDWKPDFIITAGDNNYPLGAAETIDGNIGQYYHDFISPYTGQFGCGARQNRFFPSLGNHDWYTPGARPYLDYFTLPGNERYYDVVFGDVHLFAVDSDPSEPDGVAPDSVQANWLRQTAGASRATWQIAYMHHPPFSSGPHLSNDYMRWSYKAFGIDVVFAGHDHDYERLEVDGLTYIVNGLGGAPLYDLGEILPGSKNHFAETFGAVLVDATSTTLTAKFVAVDGRTIDQMVLTAPR